MRRAFAIPCLAIMSALVLGPGTKATADSTFKVVNAPGGDQAVAATQNLPPAKPAPAGAATNDQQYSEVKLSTPTPRQVLLAPGTAREVGIERDYSAVRISNPGIIELVPITDHILLLKGIKVGNSDIFLFGGDGRLQSLLTVNVDDYNYRIHDPIPDPGSKTYSQVEVHNKEKLDSQTNFRCGPDGCHYVGEVTVAEPAALPTGYTQSTNNTNNSYTGLPPLTISPPPSAPASPAPAAPQK